MLIVVEGTDETGKTTLASALAEHRAGTCVHTGPPGEAGPLYEYARQLTEVVQDDLTVMDRFHWGEMVYGPEYRGESGLDAEMLYWLDLVIGGKGGVMVLCTDSPSDIYDRVVGNDDDFVRHDLRHLRELQAHFVQLTATTTLRVHDHSISRPLNTAMLLARTAWGGTHIISAQQTTGGHLLSVAAPSVLLVGDEPAKSGDTTTRAFPFYPRLNSSGHFLMGALRATDLHRQVMITNSLAPDGEPVDVLKLFIETPTISSVVALGRQASNRLTAQNVTHHRAFHPQYARRFYHHSKTEYAASLYAAAKLRIDTTHGGWLR